MDINLLITALALIFFSVLGVIIYRFVNKRYLEAFKNAKDYTLLSVKPEDRGSIFEDIEKFQKNIFTKSQKVYLEKISVKISEKSSEITSLSDKLSTLQSEKRSIDRENDQDKVEEISEKGSKVLKQFDSEINNLIKSIDEANTKLITLQKERDKYLNEKFEPIENKGNSNTNILSKNIDRITKLFPYYIFIILDYFIAVSFFQQYAEGLDPVLEQIIGKVIPLAITIFSLILVEWMIQGIRNKKLFGVVIPSTLLVFIFFFIAYVRINSAEATNEKVIELLMFLVFLMTVSVIGYQFDKEGIGGFELLSLPLAIIANLFQIIVSIIISPVNKISTKVYDIVTPTPCDREIKENEGRIQDLKNRLMYIRSEQTKLPSKTSEEQKQAIQSFKDSKSMSLSGVNSEIDNLNKKIIDLKQEISKLDDMDTEILRGSNEGTIAGLKKVFKIRG